MDMHVDPGLEDRLQKIVVHDHLSTIGTGLLDPSQNRIDGPLGGRKRNGDHIRKEIGQEELDFAIGRREPDLDVFSSQLQLEQILDLEVPIRENDTVREDLLHGPEVFLLLQEHHQIFVGDDVVHQVRQELRLDSTAPDVVQDSIFRLPKDFRGLFQGVIVQGSHRVRIIPEASREL